MPTFDLKQADNGFYYVHWTEGRRSKRVSTRKKNMDEAQAFLARWILMEQEGGQSEDRLFTVAELWSVYRARHVEHNVASPQAVDYLWQNLEPHFGPLTLAEIDQDCVDAYEAKRVAGRIGRVSTQSTVRRELGALRACFNWCADPVRKILLPSQAPAFNLPPEGQPRDRWLRAVEIDRLLAAADDRPLHPDLKLTESDSELFAEVLDDLVRDKAALLGIPVRVARKQAAAATRTSRGERFIRLALETAARKSALCELTWDRVDFETNVIHLNVPGRKMTKKRRADVPISKALRPYMERWHAERINDYVLDNTAEIWDTVQRIAVRAFGNETQWGSRKVKRTGISPHVFRHTAATNMARRGVPLWKIAKILGNSLAMVEKVYAKHCPDDLREAVDMISGTEARL